jgi:hypothetical protein
MNEEMTRMTAHGMLGGAGLPSAAIHCMPERHFDAGQGRSTRGATDIEIRTR